MIERTLYKEILSRLRPGRVVLLFGARRVGKTVLIREIISNYQGRTQLLNGEDADVQRLLAERSVANYRRLFGETELLAIDEAQNIPEIGWVLKLMADEIPTLRIIASGSSSFDLGSKAGEPLVGRSTSFLMTPFSHAELTSAYNPIEMAQHLDDYIVYGSYPDVVLAESAKEREEYLRDMVDAYLLKDILSFDGIKSSGKMRDLLRLIAHQTGSRVSYDELADALSLSRNTVEKYLDLLSKVYVIYRVGGFSRNLRKEISKASKWYFYDTGVRNAIIGNFSPLALRQDAGHLWENYFISERMKRNMNLRLGKTLHFWRTFDRQEIDLVEEKGTALEAFEVKLTKSAQPPVAFAKAYPDATFHVVNRNNYYEYL